MAQHFLILSFISIFIGINKSVILPGICPTPPESYKQLGPIPNQYLKALVPLREDTEFQDNFFSNIYDIEGPSCDGLIFHGDPDSSDYSFSLSKPFHRDCNRVEAVLEPQRNERNFILQYRVVPNRPKASLLQCLREDSFSNQVSLWRWNGTTILWTCNDYTANNTHDEAAIVFRPKGLAPFDVPEMLNSPLSFSKLEETHFLVKTFDLCKPSKKCPEFQCKESHESQSWLFIAGPILLVIVIIAVIFISKKLKKFVWKKLFSWN